MLEEFDRLEPLFRCPRSGSRLARCNGGHLSLADRFRFYPAIDGTPVLIDFDDSVLSPEDVLHNQATSPIDRDARGGAAGLLKRIVSPEKRVTRDNVEALIEALPQTRDSLVLVVGGGTIGQGMSALYNHPDIRIIAFDIYKSPLTQFIADAHHIPLCDNCVDAVVVQAVLEHVLSPEQVVREIWRVLRPGGLVYAETPFLQQVHEGAYDFTRFTESGHRFLFRNFALLKSGSSSGPGTQLLWSIDYFARGLFRSWFMGKLAKLAFSWLRLFDRLIPPEHASDGASGVYFLGQKSNVTMRPRDIIAFYRGAQARGAPSAPAAEEAWAEDEPVRASGG